MRRRKNLQSNSNGSTKQTLETINKTIQRRQRSKIKGRRETFLPTGSTLLNLALSDQEDGGFLAGTINNIIGDSSSGKTLLCLTCLAEASILSEFNNYRFILDDAEHACQFDIRGLFGRGVEKRLEPPRKDKKGNPIYSTTIEDFHCNVMNAINKKTPFIYVLDSFDGISSIEDEDRMGKMEHAYDKGKMEVSKSYKTGKSKFSPECLRRIAGKVKGTKSIILIISQTRRNFDMFSYKKTRRAGGDALRFWSSIELWLARESSIKNKESKRTIGHNTVAIIEKNKITGRFQFCRVGLPIYFSYGIDDIGSCIDFLKNEKVIRVVKGKTRIKALNYIGSIKELIQKVDRSKDLLDRLKNLTKDTWNKIIESLQINRRKKYE